MKYVDEFRDGKLARNLAACIAAAVANVRYIGSPVAKKAPPAI